MSQIVIDGVLFSPVLAHSLEPGDLVTLPLCLDMKRTPTRRILALRGQRNGRVYFSRSHPHPDVDSAGFSLGVNDVVYRAVGARAARGGAR